MVEWTVDPYIKSMSQLNQDSLLHGAMVETSHRKAVAQVHNKLASAQASQAGENRSEIIISFLLHARSNAIAALLLNKHPSFPSPGMVRSCNKL